jgi:hypothetical protein
LNPIEDEAVVAAAIIQYNNNNVHYQSRKRSQISGSGDVKPSKNNNTNDNDQSTTSATTTYVELIDCPKFDNVKLRNGISQWRVAEYQHDDHEDDFDDSEDGTDDNARPRQYLQWYDTYEDAVHRIGTSSNNSKSNHRYRTSTVLTPTLWSPNSTDHADVIQSLSKCQRLLPQDQDSGGFFIALIRKCTTTTTLRDPRVETEK